MDDRKEFKSSDGSTKNVISPSRIRRKERAVHKLLAISYIMTVLYEWS